METAKGHWFWVAFTDAPNGIQMTLNLDHYNTNTAENSWVLLRTNKPELLNFE